MAVIIPPSDFKLHSSLDPNECLKRLQQKTVKAPTYFQKFLIGILKRDHDGNAEVIGRFNDHEFELDVKRSHNYPLQTLRGTLVQDVQGGTAIVCSMLGLWHNTVLRIVTWLAWLILIAFTPNKSSHYNLFSNGTTALLKERLCLLGITGAITAFIIFLLPIAQFIDDRKILKSFLERNLNATEITSES